MAQRKTLRLVKSALWPLFLGDGLLIYSLIVLLPFRSLLQNFIFKSCIEIKKPTQISICLNETFFQCAIDSSFSSQKIDFFLGLRPEIQFVFGNSAKLLHM